MSDDMPTGWVPSVVEGLRAHHGPQMCVIGEGCCIHHPSDHALKDAPLLWRDDRGVMERICDHGIGHPDPDDLSYKRDLDLEYYQFHDFETHGCDGCCGKAVTT